MNSKKSIIWGTLFLILPVFIKFSVAQTNNYPHPLTNPESTIMLAGTWVPENTHEIEFSNLPSISSDHSIVSDVRYAWGTKTHQHNYLVHFDNRFWIMWSDGPGVPREGINAQQHREVIPDHDQPGQMISYATSEDGMNWSEPRYLTDPPFKDGFGWIARGFWVREGKLLALATLYNAPNYRGEGLQLHAYELVPGEDKEWKHKGLVYDNALNNFPPKKLPNDEWMMSRRDSLGNVYMLIGGNESFNKWESYPIINILNNELWASEPYWLILPDSNLIALFRDSNFSGFLFRAFSADCGYSWSKLVRTNFPDATSKFSGLKLSDGRYVLVSNPKPKKRDPLTIAISDDGLVFTKMAYLVGGRLIDYPHIIEHDGYLYIAFGGAKQTVEVLKIKISELDKINMSQITKN
jgi:hypothetical protein